MKPGVLTPLSVLLCPCVIKCWDGDYRQYPDYDNNDDQFDKSKPYSADFSDYWTNDANLKSRCFCTDQERSEPIIAFAAYKSPHVLNT